MLWTNNKCMHKICIGTCITNQKCWTNYNLSTVHLYLTSSSLFSFSHSIFGRLVILEWMDRIIALPTAQFVTKGDFFWVSSSQKHELSELIQLFMQLISAGMLLCSSMYKYFWASFKPWLLLCKHLCGTSTVELRYLLLHYEVYGSEVPLSLSIPHESSKLGYFQFPENLSCLPLFVIYVIFVVVMILIW